VEYAPSEPCLSTAHRSWSASSETIAATSGPVSKISGMAAARTRRRLARALRSLRPAMNAPISKNGGCGSSLPSSCSKASLTSVGGSSPSSGITKSCCSDHVFGVKWEFLRGRFHRESLLGTGSLRLRWLSRPGFARACARPCQGGLDSASPSALWQVGRRGRPLANPTDQGARAVGCPAADAGKSLGVPPVIHSVALAADQGVLRELKRSINHRPSFTGRSWQPPSSPKGISSITSRRFSKQICCTSMNLSDTSPSYRPLSGPGYLRRRRQQRCFPPFLIVATVVLLALPVTAIARPGYEVRTGGIELVLPVRQGAKYLVSVSANERQRVRFVAEGRSTTTEYSTKGHVSRDHISATFDSLGRLDVRLRFTRYASDPPHNGRCRGQGAHYQEGTYRGTLRFSPSGGVPAVSSIQGPVYLERRFMRTCKRQHLKSKPSQAQSKHRLEVGFLTVEGKGDGRTVVLDGLSFALRRNLTRSVGQLAVTVYERDAGVRIARQTSIPVNNDSFAVSASGKYPERVELAPPPPFAGTALYSHSLGTPPTWSGDLALNLSSTEGVSLTGARFKAAFCRATTLIRPEACLSSSS
jgi:hypothetical protein